MTKPKISIIIPLYVISDRFFMDLKKFAYLKYPNYEILVVCDQKVTIRVSKARFIWTHKSHTGPAQKRDLGLKYAIGEICAFIDDDAYPHPNWLTAAVSNFSDSKIA